MYAVVFWIIHLVNLRIVLVFVPMAGCEAIVFVVILAIHEIRW